MLSLCENSIERFKVQFQLHTLFFFFNVYFCWHINTSLWNLPIKTSFHLMICCLSQSLMAKNFTRATADMLLLLIRWTSKLGLLTTTVLSHKRWTFEKFTIDQAPCKHYYGYIVSLTNVLKVKLVCADDSIFYHTGLEFWDKRRKSIQGWCNLSAGALSKLYGKCIFLQNFNWYVN